MTSDLGGLFQMLDMAIARAMAEAQVESFSLDRAWYSYVADANGSVVFDQDYPFVCEKIAFTMRPTFVGVVGYQDYFRVRIEDRGTGHPVTLGQRVTVPGAVGTSEVTSAPAFALVPLDRHATEAILVLPVETEFPRGGAVRVVMEPAPASLAWNSITLVGYKRIR